MTIFPVLDLGKKSLNSTCRGILKLASLFSQKDRICRCAAVSPCFRTTIALNTFPRLASGIPTTAVARVLKPQGLFVFSLLHPCFLTPGSGWILEDSPDGKKGKRIGWKTDNYHLGLVYHGIMTVCDTKETYYFCRILEDYFRGLRKGGFVVEDLREPLPPKEMIERHPNFRGEEKRSVMLMMKCKLLV